MKPSTLIIGGLLAWYFLFRRTTETVSATVTYPPLGELGNSGGGSLDGFFTTRPDSGMSGQELVGASAGLAASAATGVPGLDKLGARIADLFGKGRREADQIVPTQNQVHVELTETDRVIANGTLAAKRERYDFLRGLYAQWLSFTNPSAWADGRAAQQARNTINWQIEARLDTMERLIFGRILSRGERGVG